MHEFTVHVAIRKGAGPEWDTELFEVTFNDIDSDFSIEELKEWAREEVGSRLETTNENESLKKKWVIEKVIPK